GAPGSGQAAVRSRRHPAYRPAWDLSELAIAPRTSARVGRRARAGLPQRARDGLESARASRDCVLNRASSNEWRFFERPAVDRRRAVRHRLHREGILLGIAVGPDVAAPLACAPAP